jgi:hypothetical protein
MSQLSENVASEPVQLEFSFVAAPEFGDQQNNGLQ